MVRALGVYRCWFYLVLLGVSLFRQDLYQSLDHVPPILWEPVGFFSWLPALSPLMVELLHGLFLGTTGLAAVGLFSTPAMLLAALSGGLLLNYSQCFGGGTHSVQIVFFQLLLFPFCDAGAAFSLDSRWRAGPLRPPAFYRQGVWMGRSLLVMAFFTAGVAKLQQGGLEWLDGATMQNAQLRFLAMLELSPHEIGRPIVLFLAPKLALLQLLSAFSLALELFCPLALWRPRAFRWMLLALLGMQVGIYFAMGVNFSPYLCLYGFWLPEKWFEQGNSGAQAGNLEA